MPSYVYKPRMERQDKQQHIQYVTHTNQLKHHLGYNAILTADDGDQMELTWNGERWVSPSWDYNEYFITWLPGYLSDTYQGGDSTMTIYHNGNTILFAVTNTPWADDLRIDRLPAQHPNLPDPEFELQKWLRAGLNLAGRVQALGAETSSNSGTPNIGPGITSRTIVRFGTDGTDSYTYDNSWLND